MTAGDSGGPFVCKSNENGSHFLVGVTSHGYNPTIANKDDMRCGEPNSYTAVTRMTMFIDYIEEMKQHASGSENLRENCPGRQCRSNYRRFVRALDGTVDCLAGEDETY